MRRQGYEVRRAGRVDAHERLEPQRAAVVDTETVRRRGITTSSRWPGRVVVVLHVRERVVVQGPEPPEEGEEGADDEARQVVAIHDGLLK